MKDKIGLIGGVFTVLGLLCELAKSFIDDKKQEALIDKKIEERLNGKNEEGS